MWREDDSITIGGVSFPLHTSVQPCDEHLPVFIDYYGPLPE
jgi:hypothetical protein